MVTVNTSNRRWVNVTKLHIGDVILHDALGASISLSATPVGSNSENQRYNNAHILATQMGGSITFRTYDVSGAYRVAAHIGENVNYSYVLHLSNGSSLSTTTSGKGVHYKFYGLLSCSSGVALTGVTIPAEHDAESICEITGTLLSNGLSAPWRTAKSKAATPTF